jgi:hypothetical protein
MKIIIHFSKIMEVSEGKASVTLKFFHWVEFFDLSNFLVKVLPNKIMGLAVGLT